MHLAGNKLWYQYLIPRRQIILSELTLCGPFTLRRYLIATSHEMLQAAAAVWPCGILRRGIEV